MRINTFKAFQYRNYRLFFSGQSVSLMGTWMQRTAVYWIIYLETNSAFMLGLTAFAIQFPSFLLSLVGGSVADKYNKYKVLLITQVASMIQAIALTIVVVYTDYSFAEIIILSVVLGTINAFDVPARQALLQNMVDQPEDLSNAIALNSSMANLARLIGPGVAGILLDKVGAGLCFFLNATSFMAVIAVLLMMRLPAFIKPEKTQNVVQGLKEGLRYLQSTPIIRTVVLLITLSSFMVTPYVTLLPIIAKETLHGNASTYGYLNSFTGIGALSGAIFLASVKNSANLRRLLVIATGIFGVGLLLFSFSQSIWVAFVFATLTGFGMMSQVTLSNTLLQTTSSTAMRGRVISYFAMAIFGFQPLGALLIGKLSNVIGTTVTIRMQGIMAILLAFCFLPYLWMSTQKE